MSFVCLCYVFLFCVFDDVVFIIVRVSSCLYCIYKYVETKTHNKFCVVEVVFDFIYCVYVVVYVCVCLFLYLLCCVIFMCQCVIVFTKHINTQKHDTKTNSKTFFIKYNTTYQHNKMFGFCVFICLYMQ